MLPAPGAVTSTPTTPCPPRPPRRRTHPADDAMPVRRQCHQSSEWEPVRRTIATCSEPTSVPMRRCRSSRDSSPTPLITSDDNGARRVCGDSHRATGRGGDAHPHRRGTHQWHDRQHPISDQARQFLVSDLRDRWFDGAPDRPGLRSPGGTVEGLWYPGAQLLTTAGSNAVGTVRCPSQSR